MDAGNGAVVNPNVRSTSIYLTEADRVILNELMERSGLNRTTVFRLALQKLHQQGTERQTRLLEIAEEIKRLA